MDGNKNKNKPMGPIVTRVYSAKEQQTTHEMGPSYKCLLSKGATDNPQNGRKYVK